ncbi:heparinase II/III domain-containing protein [Natrononativus amylolyticus]|uniref:heparinase II/III domain-containing protein n=1 Tax=Natrononativus amylolyticus TaxID=2963434 RepID=UPI0020CC98F1|nr:heparinase II/III family protein [Natrononativus amylolyticus]
MASDDPIESDSKGRSGSNSDQATNLDVSRRSVLTTTGAGLLAGMLPASSAVGADDSDPLNAKTRPTIWTEEMRANALANVERYDWAASARDSAVSSADGYLDEYSLDDLWSMVTGQQLPRSGESGTRRANVYTGIGDPGTDRPWKLFVRGTDGEEYVFPTNDFAAYRESGLDDRGLFNPELADDSLLVNEEYPEKGESWGVDDGYGWLDEDGDIVGAGERLYPVAYYNHWHVWRPGGILNIVQALTDAYLYTGDRRYSRAGSVLLDRIADVYPEMDSSVYTLDGFWNSTGGRMTGKVKGATWESNLMRPIVRAYDAFFPGMEGDDELVEFLEAKTDEYPGLESKSSIEEIRKNIEDGIHREILPAAENSEVVLESGGYSVVTQAARALDEADGYTQEALEWIFQPGEELFVGDQWDEEPWNWITTGGNILAPLVDVVDRDGYNNRASPMYNRIRNNSYLETADYLQGYDGFDGADLYDHPKFRRTLTQNLPLLLLDQHMPEIGNSHPNDNYVSGSAIEGGFTTLGDPIYAQTWHYLNGYSTVGIRGDAFDEDPEGLATDIQEVIDAEGPLDLPSQNLAGYGFAALRDGVNYDARSLGIVLDTSNLFAEASTEVNDSFDRAIQLQAYEPGEWWTFEFDIEEGGEYDLDIEALFVGTYGIYELTINDEYVDTIDFMADGSGESTLTYSHDLQAGTNTMRFECIGKNDDSDNYLMALYSLTLLDEEAREARDEAELGNAKRAFWLYYGRNGSNAGGAFHNHSDALNIGVAAHELELSPDLGYIEQTGGDWPKADYWTMNTVSHNTVVVDESEQRDQWVGYPHHFDGSSERVNLIDVEAPQVYPQTEEYRRTLAMVEVDEEHSYAVDFFRVLGGDDHHFSFHGQVGEATAEGVDLASQEEGTYAGEDIPMPGHGEDHPYNHEVGSGFNYLANVERGDDPDEKVAIDWDVEDHWGHRDDNAEEVHMRLTTFGEFDEVALADGEPPQHGGQPESLRYAMIHRQGEDVESTFTSVIEHYEGDRAIEAIETVDVVDENGEPADARAVKVDLATGRTDYVVYSREEDVVTVDETFRFRGFLGAYSVEGGEPEFAYVQDGRLLQPVGGRPLIQRPYGRFTGTINDFTREMAHENELEVSLEGHHDDAAAIGDEPSVTADFVFVDVDEPFDQPDTHARNGAYPVEAIESAGGNRVTVDVGDRTFIKAFTDPDELEDGGYEYIVGENDGVVIPVAETWSRDE